MAAQVPCELFVFFPLSKCLEGWLYSCVSHRQLGLMAQHVFMPGVCEGYCSLGLSTSCFQAAEKLKALKTLFILILTARGAQGRRFPPASCQTEMLGQVQLKLYLPLEPLERDEAHVNMDHGPWSETQFASLHGLPRAHL